MSGFFFNDTATTEIYTVPYTLSLHDALPILGGARFIADVAAREDVALTVVERRRSEEHTSELQSHGTISYAVFCLKQKKPKPSTHLLPRKKLLIINNIKQSRP